jgi:hypothetical protein
MAGAFLFFLHALGLHGFPRSLEIVFAIWLIAVVPIIVTNFVFIKLHPAVLVSHSLGWLARLGIFAASFSIILDR